MKKAKSISDQEDGFFGPQKYVVRAGMATSLMVSTAFGVGFAAGIATLKNAHAAPPNLVTVPLYTGSHGRVAAPDKDDEDDGDDEDSGEDSKPLAKIQYEPANDETPILHKKVEHEQLADGAHYDEGYEVVVEPESKDLAISLAPVIEKDAVDHR